MGFLDKLFSTGIKGVVEAVADTVDQFVMTKEEKAAFEERAAERTQRADEFDREQINKEQERLVELYKIDQVDRTSAREFAGKELTTDDKFVRRFRYYLAAGIILLFTGIIILILVYKFDDSKRDIINYVLGTLSGILVSIISFYFGSSQGSSLKQEVINKELNLK